VLRRQDGKFSQSTRTNIWANCNLGEDCCVKKKKNTSLSERRFQDITGEVDRERDRCFVFSSTREVRNVCLHVQRSSSKWL